MSREAEKGEPGVPDVIGNLRSPKEGLEAKKLHSKDGGKALSEEVPRGGQCQLRI